MSPAGRQSGHTVGDPAVARRAGAVNRHNGEVLQRARWGDRQSNDRKGVHLGLQHAYCKAEGASRNTVAFRRLLKGIVIRAAFGKAATSSDVA